jgi:hypothetical protein
MWWLLNKAGRIEPPVAAAIGLAQQGYQTLRTGVAGQCDKAHGRA